MVDAGQRWHLSAITNIPGSIRIPSKTFALFDSVAAGSAALRTHCLCSHTLFSVYHIMHFVPPSFAHKKVWAT